MNDGDTVDEPTVGGGSPPGADDPSDDDILTAMENERVKKADDALLGDEDDEPTPKGKRPKDQGKKASKAAKKDEPEEDDSDDLDDDDAEDDDEDDDGEEEPTPRNLQRARKLFDKGDFKGALKAALGLKDEDLEASGDWDDAKFVNAKFRAFRKKVEKQETAARERDAKHTEREEKFSTYVKGLGVKLQPAFEWFKAKQEYAKTGDPNIIVQVMEDFAGEGYDIVQKKVLRGTKDSPTERRLLQKITELEAKLTKVGEPKEQTPEEKQAKAQEDLREYISEIKEEIAEHDVRKIPGAAKKVYAMLRKHYDPKLKAPRISIEDAADRVLRVHMRMLARLQPAAKTEKKTPTKVFAHSRVDTREAGLTDDDPSDDDILRQMEIERAKRRREEAKAKAGKR